MTSLKTSIKTITYLSDIGCLEIQGASLKGTRRICSELSANVARMTTFHACKAVSVNSLLRSWE
ncbi:hypothetical protein CWG82_25340 [Salmonella enterica subsp. enterica serovar Mikawasima]|nr:hypothetical protein [Salmonella enterica subsp. enterica serovar Mikawasima]